MNTFVLYNLDQVEIVVVQSTLTQGEMVQKVKHFKDNGGIHESDFVDALEQAGHKVNWMPVETIDFNNLDNYEE